MNAARGVLADPDSAAAIEQACEQLALVSAANDETTQALYLLPWSGQSDEPSSGASRSTVTLTVTGPGGVHTRTVINAVEAIEAIQAGYSEVFEMPAWDSAATVAGQTGMNEVFE